MKQIKPTQPPQWRKTSQKWNDLSYFERRAFEICCDLRRNKEGKVYLSTRGRAYYTPKPRPAGNYRDVYVQPKRPAIKKRSMAFRYFIFFLKMLLLVSAVSIVMGAVVGQIRSQLPTEYISPLPEDSTKEKQTINFGEATKAEAKAVEEVKPLSIEDMIRAKFGNKSELALAIARCESTMNPSAIGDKNLNPKSYGLYQVRAFKGRPSVEELLTPEGNIEYAYLLSQGGTDWSHWSCFSKGYYLKHMNMPIAVK